MLHSATEKEDEIGEKRNKSQIQWKIDSAQLFYTWLSDEGRAGHMFYAHETQKGTNHDYNRKPLEPLVTSQIRVSISLTVLVSI